MCFLSSKEIHDPSFKNYQYFDSWRRKNLTLPIDQKVTKLINYQCSIFSHSTISSGLNAVAAVLLEDFVKPYCCKKISGYAATLFSKATGKF